MIDLEQARAIATRPVEHSGHEQQLRALIFDLCDELEQLRAACPDPVKAEGATEGENDAAV